MVAFVVTQAVGLEQLYRHPLYQNLPEVYDYSDSETFTLDPLLNSMSVSIGSNSDFGQPYVNKNLRVMFKTASVGKNIFVDSVYCKDYFAD